MFATYNNNTRVTLKSNTMEKNWIILALIFVCAIALIIFLIIRNQKDKNDVISAWNAQEDFKEDSDQKKP
jgi:uncharacterized membrane protein